MRITMIVGVRPHFVKLAALLPHLREHGHEITVIHTGQHYNFTMSTVFYRELQLPEPNHHLGVGSGSHAQQTGACLIGIERVLKEIRPDVTLVLGDANSSLAGSLAAAKLGIPVGHIEAGASNNDLKMPEQINRLVIDSITTLFFCPTRRARANLHERGVKRHLYFTGDLLLDSALRNLPTSETHSTVMAKLNLEKKRYLLVTVHRVANTEIEERLRKIVVALQELSTHERIVFPAHPRTWNALEEYDLMHLLTERDNIILTEPQAYLDILQLQKNARLVLTDSNGVQRESFFLGTPSLILRESTEYPETVEIGASALVDVDIDRIMQKVSESIAWPHSHDLELFGGGKAAERISSILSDLSPQDL